MKYPVLAFILLSFVGLSVFGFLAIHQQSGKINLGCLAAIFKRTDCPESNALFSANFHLGILKAFSEATPNSSAAAAFIFLLAVSAMTLIPNVSRIFGWLPPTDGFIRPPDPAETSPVFSKDPFIGWLEIRYNSPNFSRGQA